MAQCVVKRNWILGGYSAEYSHSGALTRVALSKTIHHVLTALSRHLHLHRNTGEGFDIKGRDRGESLLPELPSPQTDEVFRVGGVVATASRNSHFHWTPFDVGCSAEFRGFEGSHHIRHALSVQRSDSIPEWLPWQLVGAAIPVQPAYLRVGLERFRSRFTVASFGYLPQVTDSLLLDASDRDLRLRLITEQPRWRVCNPFREIEIFSEVANALSAALGVNLAESFHEELVQSGKLRE